MHTLVNVVGYVELCLPHYLSTPGASNSIVGDECFPRAFLCKIFKPKFKTTTLDSTEIINEFKAPVPLDLVPLISTINSSHVAHGFTPHSFNLIRRIHNILVYQNAYFKLLASLYRRVSHRYVDDLVLACLTPERMPPGTLKILTNRQVHPLRILREFGNMIFLLEFSTDWGITSIFIVSYFTLHASIPLEISTFSYIFSTLFFLLLVVSLCLDRYLHRSSLEVRWLLMMNFVFLYCLMRCQGSLGTYFCMTGYSRLLCPPLLVVMCAASWF
ncbi:hypothetical protein KSP40_PGU011472 [Platanthera guangdongensis]|uniref:Reverse transcriptase domain-containing protein n=1 Tax=Platanthera guangdongensis TaxID=2320717 RepID=A0ABR2LQM8_9ASPA